MSHHVSPLRALIAATLTVAVPAATVAGARPAAAQPGKPVDKKKLAREYTAAGLSAADAGDYDTAISFYAKAYEQVPHPILLFNVAQAHRLAGRPAQAIDHYKKYLAADPRGPKARLAQEFLTALELQVAADAGRKAEEEWRKAEEARKAEDARKAADARTARDTRKAADARTARDTRNAEDTRRAEDARKAEDTRAADDTRRAEDTRENEEARKANAVGPDDEARKVEEARMTEEMRNADGDAPAPAGKAGRGLRLTGLAAMTVGVAAGGVGIFYFGGKAQRLSDEVSEHGVMYDPDKDAAGETANRNMIIATAAGGALVIGGVVLYVVGRRKGAAAERVSVTPAIGPDRVGLVIGGTLP